MQISKTNNVIFLKDAESNIIQEAFVVLKDNIKFECYRNTSNDSQNNKDVINVLKEAESLINQEINSCNIKYDKYKISKLEKKLKVLKIFNVISIIVFIIAIILK